MSLCQLPKEIVVRQGNGPRPELERPLSHGMDLIWLYSFLNLQGGQVSEDF